MPLWWTLPEQLVLIYRLHKWPHLECFAVPRRNVPHIASSVVLKALLLEWLFIKTESCTMIYIP